MGCVMPEGEMQSLIHSLSLTQSDGGAGGIDYHGFSVGIMKDDQPLGGPTRLGVGGTPMPAGIGAGEGSGYVALLALNSVVCPQLLFALNCCLPYSTTVCSQLFALNCLPSTVVCPQLLFALN